MSVRPLAALFLATVAVAACSPAPQPPPAAPFSVVEASFAEMQQAMAEGRVTSRTCSGSPSTKSV
jgi:nitrous oxide reductase accessory protein NosL